MPHPLPPPMQAPFYLLVETSGSDAEHDGQKMERFLEGLMAQGLVLGASVVAVALPACCTVAAPAVQRCAALAPRQQRTHMVPLALAPARPDPPRPQTVRWRRTAARSGRCGTCGRESRKACGTEVSESRGVWGVWGVEKGAVLHGGQ